MATRPRGEDVPLPEPKLAPREPATRVAAAREKGLNAAHGLKDALLEALRDFRASNRFFKMKALVVAAWSALSFAALLVAFPLGNSLDAHVSLRKVTPVDRTVLAIFLENRGDEDWGEALLTLDERYTYKLANLRGFSSEAIALERFADGNGQPPPAGLKLEELEIRSPRGRVTLDLPRPPP